MLWPCFLIAFTVGGPIKVSGGVTGLGGDSLAQLYVMVYECTVAGGLRARVGENALENQALCRSARQNDWWFHLESLPSPHCVLENPNGAWREPPREAVLACAQLVKERSKWRQVHRVTVIYLPAKYVSRRHLQSDEKPGSVVLLKEPRRVVI